MIWTAALGGEICGGCGLTFTPDQALGLLTSKALKRCELCAAPSPVDQGAVEAVIAERTARWAEQANAQITKPGHAHAPVLDGFTAAGDVAQSGLNNLLKFTGGIKGVRRPKPFHEVSDDPVIARLCAEGDR